MLFRRNLTKKQYVINALTKELRYASKGRIPAKARRRLAKRTVERMDFSNPYQMHKSLRGYADILADNFFQKQLHKK